MGIQKNTPHKIGVYLRLRAAACGCGAAAVRLRAAACGCGAAACGCGAAAAACGCVRLRAAAATMKRPLVDHSLVQPESKTPNIELVKFVKIQYVA